MPKTWPKQKRKAKPTGDCYDAALDAANSLKPNKDEKVWLVHGFITSNAGRIAHAWVEMRTTTGELVVLEMSQGRRGCVSKEHYYGVLKAEPVVKYKPDDAVKMLFKTKHSGPWHEAKN